MPLLPPGEEYQSGALGSKTFDFFRLDASRPAIDVGTECIRPFIP